MSARWQEDRLAPLVKLGADIDERIGHAAMLEAAAVPDDLVRWLARVSARGRMDYADAQYLASRGIAIPSMTQDGGAE